MKITVYGGVSCPQCKLTTERLTRSQIAFDYVDLDTDEAARTAMIEEGHRSRPIVKVDTGSSQDVWTGFRPDKLRNLGA